MNKQKFNYTYLLFSVACSLLFIKCNKGPEYDKLIPFQEEEDGRWGYINFNGRKKIETKFNNPPSLFFEGLALVSNMDDTYDFINRKGMDMGKSFESATFFKDGVACAVEEDQYPVIINKNLEVITRLDSIEEVSHFSEGLAAFMNKKNKWGYIDKTGKIVIQPVYDEAGLFSEGLALIEKKTEEYDSINKENKTKILKGYINKNGNEVIKPADKFYQLSSFSDGLAAYSNGSEWGWGFINKKGEKVIRANTEWDDVTLFNNGFASVKVDGYWGLINKKGETIIKPKYDYPLYFSNRLASVEIDDKIGFINKKGKITIEPLYDDIASSFFSGRSIVQDGLYYKIINKKGNQINDVELYNVDLSSDYYYFIKSDYFDVNPILDTLITELNSGSVLGLNGKSDIQSVLDKFKLSKDILPANTWNDYISLSSVGLNDATVYRTFYFTSNVSEAITERVSYGYYYSYYETVGYKPNSQSFLKSVKFEINLTDRGYDKEEKLVKAFRELLQANGYNMDEESKGNILVLVSQSNECKVIIDYNQKNNVIVSFNF